MNNPWDTLDTAALRKNSFDSDNNSSNPLIVVSCYQSFKDLAHQPRGDPATFGLYTYRLDVTDGHLTLLSIEKSEDKNPAFIRLHPKKKVVYVCTESVLQNGQVLSYEYDNDDGKLTLLGSQSAGGTSTCYLTIDKQMRHMLVVNYWNASVVTLPMNQVSGVLEKECSEYHPTKGKMKAKAGNHVNHSVNDSTAQMERQSDPHSHAVVLDPYLGCIAYVPDLGMDCIRELYYDDSTGQLTWLNDIKVGVTNLPHGPRYIEFHSNLSVAYVVNEISSQVAVFRVERSVIKEIHENGNGTEEKKVFGPTLVPIQCISTLPSAFPGEQNTCGRITVHPSGKYVIVSNRGHDSLVVFRIKAQGRLCHVGWFNTRGTTPRHFQFDKSGQWLIVANQDTNSLVVFEFNVGNGKLKFTNNVYQIPSPNFVGCCDPDD